MEELSWDVEVGLKTNHYSCQVYSYLLWSIGVVNVHDDDDYIVDRIDYLVVVDDVDVPHVAV